MQLSAEIRWFWSVKCPDAIETWFQSGPTQPGGGDAREDEYLHEPSQTEFGLKQRGKKLGVEAKGLVAVLHHPSDAVPFVGPIEIWCKWQSSTLTIRDLPTVRTRKVRWLRKFDTNGREPTEIPLGEDAAPHDRRPQPTCGCNVELTRVELSAERVWWTSVSRPSAMSSVEQSLRSTLS